MELDGPELKHHILHTAIALWVGVAGLAAAGCLRGSEAPPASPAPAAESAAAALASGPEIGAPAPEIALRTRDGQPFRLADARGKAVVINFWASWCAPCREEMPRFEAASREHAGRVVFVGVNATTLDNRDAALEFADDRGVTFPLVFDEDGSAGAAYGVSALPATFFVDAEGVLRARALGPVLADRLREQLALVGIP